MAVLALADVRPEIHPDAWVHPSAQVIGAVRLGPGVTVWPCAVIRGDFGTIEVGAGSVIEDGCVLHAGEHTPLRIGEDVVVGHLVHIEGCEVGDAVLIGSGSSVLPGAVVETGGLVAARALVTSGMCVPAGMRAQGVPAELVPNTIDPAEVRAGAANYRRNAARHRDATVMSA